MRKIFYSFIASILFGAAGLALAASPLRVGVEGAYPPFSKKEADAELKHLLQSLAAIF